MRKNERNDPRSSSGRRMQQGANRIEQGESRMQSQPRHPKKKIIRGRDLRGIGRIVGTLLLVVVVTMTIFFGIFLAYVRSNLKGNVEFYIDEFESKVSTELYAENEKNGEWELYQTLFMEGENRIWVDLEDIPKDLQKAAVAIEDKRFYSHHGVDFIGTSRAIFKTMLGGSVQGGSTLTQQLIKNATGDNQTTVKRKVIEIYRALECEKRYEKDEILEAYLNEVFFGESCYGVKTAALMYFGKDVSDLTLAECASLIAITNNPSRFDPLLGEWQRGNNLERQSLVLKAMLDQKKISRSEYDAAMSEDVLYTNGYTIHNNFMGEDGIVSGEDLVKQLEKAQEESTKQVSTAWNSYFTDAMIEDVADALMDKFGYDYNTAINQVYGGGYKIYTTVNLDYQKIAENVYEDTANLPYTTTRTGSDGNTITEQLQSAITVMDPYTGDIVAMVGGAGAKTADRGWNWATEPRPCGSSTKPISVYAPALDNGTITAATTLDDYPVMMLQIGDDPQNTQPWPKNDSGDYRGLVTVRRAIFKSLNTCAIRVCNALGAKESYNFMTENLGFSTLTAEDSNQLGNMALGGYSVGVTTEEMCAAYCTFPNEGVFNKPRTFVKVEDANGKVVLENEVQSRSAMKASTASIMNSMLQDVITQGTGGAAYFSGMHIAGKTGTTNDLKDKYFVGYSPYYCAAVWCGYESNTRINSGGINPAAVLWQKVMSKIHENLADKSFESSGLVAVNVCQDSGMLATAACENDPRGSRVTTEYCASDNVPTEYCTMHTGGGTLNYSRAHFFDYPDLVALDDDYVQFGGYIMSDGSTNTEGMDPNAGISGAEGGQINPDDIYYAPDDPNNPNYRSNDGAN